MHKHCNKANKNCMKHYSKKICFKVSVENEENFHDFFVILIVKFYVWLFCKNHLGGRFPVLLRRLLCLINLLYNALTSGNHLQQSKYFAR